MGGFIKNCICCGRMWPLGGGFSVVFFKRISLLFMVNIAVVALVSVLAFLLGLDKGYVNQMGLDYNALLGFCLLWGFAGAFISLLMSRFLAKSMMGVRLVSPNSSGKFGELARLVHDLARRSGLSHMPEVGYYEGAELNAFATGPSSRFALVAVSTGLLDRMDADSLEGVLAHEITHISNGDMVTMTLVQGVMNSFVLFFSRILAYAISSRTNENGRRDRNHFLEFALSMVFQVVFGLLASIVVGWFSRLREYRADEGGALLAGPAKMIRALQSLRASVTKEEGVGDYASAYKISGGSNLIRLFSSHPPLEVRIARLRELFGNNA